MCEKLVKHFRQGDVQSFRDFVRINPDMFNQMVEDLTPRLQKKTTNRRKPMCTGLKLAITLRYLATGDSYNALAYGFRVSPTPSSLLWQVCAKPFTTITMRQSSSVPQQLKSGTRCQKASQTDGCESRLVT